MATKADILLVVITESETKAIIDAFTPVSGMPTKFTINDRVYHDLGTVNNSRVSGNWRRRGCPAIRFESAGGARRERSSYGRDRIRRRRSEAIHWRRPRFSTALLI